MLKKDRKREGAETERVPGEASPGDHTDLVGRLKHQHLHDGQPHEGREECRDSSESCLIKCWMTRPHRQSGGSEELSQQKRFLLRIKERGKDGKEENTQVDTQGRPGCNSVGRVLA